MAADDKFTYIKDLRPGMKNVTCVFIVIDRGTVNQTKDGSTVRKCRVADKTGSISFSLWNEQAEAIEPGDILRLVKGYASLWKGVMMLYSGKYGQLEKIGEFTMVFSEVPDMSDTGHDFIQQYQKERGMQETSFGGGSRSSHPGNRNGNNHNPPQGMEREQQLPPQHQHQQQQYAVGNRGHTVMPAAVTDYRTPHPGFSHPGTPVQQPSPPHSYPSPQAPLTNHQPHIHMAQPQLPRQSILGAPRGDNIHSHMPPQRTSLARSEGHRYQPYPIRR